MSWQEVFESAGRVVLSRDDLFAFGATRRSLTAATRTGFLIRARRDHYLLPSASTDIVHAIRVGGRLGCVSALAEAGVFAFDTRETHIHMEESMSRARSAQATRTPLSERKEGIELHWRPMFRNEYSSAHSVNLEDALAQSVWCQHPWHALASLDNALFLGLIDGSSLDRIFANLPGRFQYLREQLDGQAESGQETVLRMIIQGAGLRVRTQVRIAGVGRVDMLVEDCLVVEADSRLAHDGWPKHVADRRRDLLLAARGYMSLRPVYAHTMHEPDLVRDAVLSLVAARRLARS
jgi:very-short-patch-repair endonuclease